LGDDSVAANTNFGNDQLFGDAGNDVLVGERGYDSLWGGDGNDLFLFGYHGAVQDASTANLLTAATAAHHDQTDVIMDFTDGEDKVGLSFTVDHVYHQQTGVTFTSVDAALVYAEQLLDAATAAGNEVAAIQVGADTYLFYNDTNHAVTGADAAHSINSVIKVAGVTATAFDSDGSDFI
ncbi:MAG TPA: M10 family metallopeptidase C-terminal domain-containing protein, partial [Sphingomonas sp.]